MVNHNVNYNSTQAPVVETQITDLALNNDGKLLYAACGDKVKIWDLRKYVSLLLACKLLATDFLLYTFAILKNGLSCF